MAESNYSPPLHNPFAMPNPIGPHAQGSRTLAPSFQPNFADYNNSNSWSDFHQPPPSQFGHQIPEPSPGHSGPFHYLHQSRMSPYHHFSDPVSPRAGYYPTPSDMFPHGPPAVPLQSLPPTQFHSLPMSSDPRPAFGDSTNGNELLPMIEPTMPSSHTYHLPPYSHFTQPQMHTFNPYPGRRPNPTLPSPTTPILGRFGSDAMQSGVQGRGPMRGANPGPPNVPRVISPPSRRTSYERQHQSGAQAPGGPDRRPQPFLGNRRSDRSVSPRTSNRRSFERYATDLPQSSGSSDAEEAALRARIHRARQQRQRLSGGSDFRRAYTSIDSNIPTAAQLQALKDKLRHFLPNELPEGTSTSCDICQKDFSTKYVSPTEDDEIAIQLPCKHVFGEFCFQKWIDTCTYQICRLNFTQIASCTIPNLLIARTTLIIHAQFPGQQHKNKITCPMCRKLLIEPVQRSPAELYARMPDVMTLFSRTIDRRSISQLSQADRNLLEQVLGPLEGDFPHA